MYINEIKESVRKGEPLFLLSLSATKEEILNSDLDLYKFLESTSTEIHWNGDELVIWLHPYDIKDFAKLVGYDYLSEGGIECRLQGEGYIALDIVGLCEFFDIEPSRILEREE